MTTVCSGLNSFGLGVKCLVSVQPAATRESYTEAQLCLADKQPSFGMNSPSIISAELNLFQSVYLLLFYC